MEIIIFTLDNEFIVPLFDGKIFNQHLIILMVRSLANVLFQENLGEASCTEAKTVKNRKECYDAKRKHSREKVV